ncbi:MAG: hypothetical protein QXJ21_08845 [Thermofilum sp.]
MTGWSTVLVTERRHPYIDRYWPPGHIIGGSTPSSTGVSLPQLHRQRRGCRTDRCNL